MGVDTHENQIMVIIESVDAHNFFEKINALEEYLHNHSNDLQLILKNTLHNHPDEHKRNLANNIFWELYREKFPKS